MDHHSDAESLRSNLKRSIVALRGGTGQEARSFAALLLVAALFAAGCAAKGPDPDGVPAPPAVEEFAFAPGYAGSDVCGACHEREYRAWRETLHSRMEQPATPDSVAGPFTPEGIVVPVAGGAKRVRMLRDGDRYVVEAPDATGALTRYEVERTVGNRFKQRYLTKLTDGSWHALPVQWLVKDGTYAEWSGLASGAPGTDKHWLDDGWQWQVRCAGCHVTGLSIGYDPATKRYDTRWRELAIGCEACHGPGAAHARAGGGVGNVLCPSRMSRDRQIDVCGKCHSRGTAGEEQGVPAGLPRKLSYPPNMLPGTVLDSAYLQYEPEQHPADFHGDGSSKNHHQQWNDYQLSDMLKNGGDKAPTCTGCHDPHRADALRHPVKDNSICVECHADLRPPSALAKHTGHGGDPAANDGARCVSCHMPRIVNHAGSVKLSSHTFRPPNPERARETKTPDACLLCHQDRDSAWSAAEAARLWPRAARIR